ncbi:Uma2 family endonuclease [Actinocrinis puniceicyclus]|uniref:Uma2 family endonuclease n=1 Tax=Actinocrinis puniceicyclus TaxID=977794 RepID=A0A8J7WK35_9ACTN|nr:Uma2 family endonuclease [Actinocrinis puniceicyclus]MBS2963751.1 Uma2 family endonuclease [Actinocrinis puniceicyclus]
MTQRYDRPADQPEEVEVTAMLEQAVPVLLEINVPERFKKAEIIGGNIIMSPLRSAHNLTLHRLMSQLDQQLPADMLYTSDVLTPFEIEQHEYCPDIAVVPRAEAEDNNISVCDPAWIACVFEIISPTTRDFDYGVKVGVYARSSIAEYVVFDPYTRSATRYAQPEDGEYTLRQLIHYGKPVHIERPFPIVIETAGLPVDPAAG